MYDEMEPGAGKYDFEEGFRQNPGLPRFDVPNWMRDRVHGKESSEDAQARALAEEAEEFLSVAHLDTDANA